MPQFEYIALDAAGRRIPGSLVASARGEALRMIEQLSLTPLSLSETRSFTSVFRTSKRSVRPAAVAAAFSLLADQLETGVPLLKALQVLAKQSSDPGLQRILSEVCEKVADGTSLASAFAGFPDVFGSLETSIVEAGEEGGFLEDSLRRLASVRERHQEIRAKLVSVLAYPLLLTIVGAMIVTGMLVFFVPKFEPLFDSLRQTGQMPWPTELLLFVSHLLQQWGLLIGAGVLVVILLLRWGIPQERMQEWRDQASIRVKGLGPVLTIFGVARFCRILGTLLQNGVPILRSLEIARHATGNRVLSRAIAEASESIARGKALSGPLAASGFFTPDVLEMLSVAEQSNRLEPVLLRLADKLETRGHQRLDVLMRLLEPMLMLVLAIVVGFLIVALLLPVFEGNGMM